MKKCFLRVAYLCMCTGFALAGCNKDGDSFQAGAIEDITVAAVENGEFIDVDTVKAWMGNCMLAESEYDGGKFALALPKTVDNQYLRPVKDGLNELISNDNLVISNLATNNHVTVNGEVNALVGGIKLLAFNSAPIAPIVRNGVKSTDDMDVLVPGGWEQFFYMKYDVTDSKLDVVYGIYCYANADVSITGSVSETSTTGIQFTINGTYSVFLKKGWNIIYIKMSKTYSLANLGVAATTFEVTTTPQSDLKWYYGDPTLSRQHSIAAFAGTKTRLSEGLK